MYYYDDIFLFVKIVEIGSFTSTAKILKISQSTISRRMNRLEEQLNLKLFRQASKGFELTEAGKVLYNSFKNKNAGFDDLIDDLIKEKQSLNGKLKVLLPTILTMNYIAIELPAFLRQYPGINLEICLQTQELDLIKYGFDMAIISHMPHQPTQKIRKIYTQGYSFYCTKEYKKKYGGCCNLNPQSCTNLLKSVV